MIGSGSFRAGFVALTFGNNGGVNTGAQFLREFVELGVPVDFNGALGGVANDVAVMAPL